MRIAKQDGTIEHVAWCGDFHLAPRGPQILVRHPEWECPAVMKWTDDYSVSGEWVFCESAIAEIDGALIDLSGCEWTDLPD